MKQAVLSNTSLCAIVREEEMNPAGGIADFLDCSLPFVEEAVIVDTGSVKDKTLDILKKYQRDYPHLKVSSRVFRGFGHARNISMNLATKKWILILDADERLFYDDFVKLRKILESPNRHSGFSLEFLNVCLDESYLTYGQGLRLLRKSAGIYFERDTGEVPRKAYAVKNIGVAIKHFKADSRSQNMKSNIYYANHKKNGKFLDPTTCEGYECWKTFNPRRNEYYPPVASDASNQLSTTRNYLRGVVNLG